MSRARIKPVVDSARILCPACKQAGPSSVIDSRPTANAMSIRRRRACQSCRARWTTYELSAETYARIMPLLKHTGELNTLRALLAQLGPMIEAAHRLPKVRPHTRTQPIAK